MTHPIQPETGPHFGPHNGSEDGTRPAELASTTLTAPGARGVEVDLGLFPAGHEDPDEASEVFAGIERMIAAHARAWAMTVWWDSLSVLAQLDRSPRYLAEMTTARLASIDRPYGFERVRAAISAWFEQTPLLAMTPAARDTYRAAWQAARDDAAQRADDAVKVRDWTGTLEALTTLEDLDPTHTVGHGVPLRVALDAARTQAPAPAAA